MAIGDSKLHKMLARRRLLSDALLWFEQVARSQPLKAQVLDWIKTDQLLRRGVDGTGQVIGYYSLTTSLINPQKAFNTPFTLFDKGYFFRSMFVQVTRDAIDVDARSASFTEMQQQAWFTDKILDLTNENFEKLKGEIKTLYIAAIKEILLVN